MAANESSAWMQALCCGNIGQQLLGAGDERRAKYKLRYFDIRGLGEPIRLLFHFAGVSFEDVRVRREDWPEVKQDTKFGRLPELTVDGRVFGQSAAIGRHLGRRFGLDAQDDWERARLDEMSDLLKDMSNELATYVGTAIGMREGDQAELRKTQYLPTVRKYLPLFERRLEENGAFLAPGNKPTWADFFLEEYLTTLQNVEKNALRKYPLLSSHLRRIRELPELKAYLADRPESVI